MKGKAKGDFWTDLEKAVTKAGEEVSRARDQEKKLRSIISDPSILDIYSEAELENLRITTESEIDTYSKAQQDSQNMSVPDALHAVGNRWYEDALHPRRTVVNLVIANQQRRSKPHQPVTAADRRQQLANEITDLIGERDDIIRGLSQRNAPQEEIKQMENMYNDAIQKKQAELRSLLLKP